MLKNRRNAILITIAVAILATLFGVHRSLNALARDIEAEFYKEGYGETNISAQLEKRMEAVLGVITITKNYPELEKQTEELRQARRALLAAESISEKGYADLKMSFALEAMLTFGTKNDEGYYNRVGVNFSEDDKTALKHYLDTIVNASAMIHNGGRQYNAEVEKFLNGEAYSGFAALLKPLTFVKSPQLFVNNQS